MRLYVIKDAVSDVVVSSLIPALNDGVALNGFKQFLKGQEEAGLNKAMFTLCWSGEMDDDGTLHGQSPKMIAAGDEVDEVFESWLSAQILQNKEF